MGTTIVRPVAEGTDTPDEDRGLRRLLVVVLGVLAVAAVGLVVVLFVLLRPEATPRVLGETAGYPIKVVRSISGFGTAPNQAIRSPLAVAFDPSGRLWVSDTGNSRVLVLTATGKLVKVVGDSGVDRLASPYGIAVDRARQRVYVADWTNRAVFVYSLTGKYLTRFPPASQNLGVFGPDGFSPYDVRVVGGRIVVSSNDGLYFFDRDGSVTARWGGPARGGAVGEFNFPDAFDVDPVSGRVYVADTLNRRVVALDRDGKVQWVSGTPDQAGKITGFWQLPRGLVRGPDGRLYVTDTFRFDDTGVGLGHLVVLSGDGTLVSEFGRAGQAEDSFNFPEKLAVGPDGLYAIADREGGRVLLFRLGPLPEPKAEEVASYQRSLARPAGVSVARQLTVSPTTSPTTAVP